MRKSIDIKPASNLILHIQHERGADYDNDNEHNIRRKNQKPQANGKKVTKRTKQTLKSFNELTVPLGTQHSDSKKGHVSAYLRMLRRDTGMSAIRHNNALNGK